MTRTYILCNNMKEAKAIARTREIPSGWHYVHSRGDFSGSARPQVFKTPDRCWTKGRRPDVVDEITAELGYRSAHVTEIPCAHKPESVTVVVNQGVLSSAPGPAFRPKPEPMAILLTRCERAWVDDVRARRPHTHREAGQ